MKKYHYITSLLLAGSSLLMSGCQDDFSELKQDPSTVTKGDIGYLFAQGVLECRPDVSMDTVVGQHRGRDLYRI